MDGNAQGRTRMNFSQNAKGLWQIEITSEYATPEESAANMSKAIDEAREVAKTKGLTLVTA